MAPTWLVLAYRIASFQSICSLRSLSKIRVCGHYLRPLSWRWVWWGSEQCGSCVCVRRQKRRPCGLFCRRGPLWRRCLRGRTLLGRGASRGWGRRVAWRGTLAHSLVTSRWLPRAQLHSRTCRGTCTRGSSPQTGSRTGGRARGSCWNKTRAGGLIGLGWIGYEVTNDWLRTSISNGQKETCNTTHGGYSQVRKYICVAQVRK